jgi:hypothetical protein
MPHMRRPPHFHIRRSRLLLEPAELLAHLPQPSGCVGVLGRLADRDGLAVEEQLARVFFCNHKLRCQVQRGGTVPNYRLEFTRSLSEASTQGTRYHAPVAETTTPQARCSPIPGAVATYTELYAPCSGVFCRLIRMGAQIALPVRMMTFMLRTTSVRTQPGCTA